MHKTNQAVSAPEKTGGIRQFFAENKRELCAAGVAFVLIISSGLYFGCKLWQMLPLFVSLGVMTLQMKANRYMFLLGGFNAGVGYTAVYISQGLYASAAYAALCSAPIQLITFVLWQRRAYKHSTKLKRLSKKQILWISVGFAAAWLVMYFAFSLLGSPYMVLDNTVSLVGILGSILSLLSYLEYTVLSVVSSIVSIFLYIDVILDQLDQIPYLIYTVYGAITTCISFRYMRKLYKEQQEAPLTE